MVRTAALESVHFINPLDCKDELGGFTRCTSISQEKLLDRIIQHAELIYRVSEESCALFVSLSLWQIVLIFHPLYSLILQEDMFIPLPMRAVRIQGGNVCMAQPFPIPSSKSELQQISDKWLLHSVLMLVQSWIEPLVYLQTTLNQYDDAPDNLLNKTKWVAEKLLSLEQGVVVLMRKMLEGGILTTSVHEQSVIQPDVQPEMLDSILRDYNVLTCFKKDVHKMETLLKLLKCRQFDKFSCILY
uniref:Somatolactin n=1 Tax=Denticeps clupeoides TaxID=299321 RepID=A0AAY4DY69_9TELE